MIAYVNPDSAERLGVTQSLTYRWTSRYSGAHLLKLKRTKMGAGQGEGQGSGGDDGCRLLALIAALFLPPVAVLLTDGCGFQLLINILLTCLGFLPGIVHAFWVVLKTD